MTPAATRPTPLADSLQNPLMRDIAAKVEARVAVTREDALALLATHDILELGVIADYVRTRTHGEVTYYGVNMNLNYTNICELRCPLCAYSCDAGDERGFVVSLAQVEERMRQAADLDIDEVHIVGGLNPDLKLDYFEALLRRVKALKPGVHVVAFTAVEYDYFARLNGLPLETVFRRLMAAGVDALPGGGAEIFAPAVRQVIAPKKISGERWLEVMRTAHGLGLKTNATMLYNHREQPADIVDHLARIRDLQTETGGFKTFVPLQFHEANTSVKAKRTTTGFDDIRIYATARIFLHNVPHIKALWMYVGDKMAQVLQKFGVDDIGATYHNEKVVHAAGAQTPDFGSEAHLRRLITDAGLKPVRTAADYGAPGQD